MKVKGEDKMFVKVNGVELFYKVEGEGKPIILIHGNGEDNRIFDVLTEELKKNYKVYRIDSRCHGQSTKGCKINYTSMMEDVAEFIKELKIEKPVFYGFSDGGIIGIMLAIKYPSIMSKLIISGANINPSGLKNSLKRLLKLQYFLTKDLKIKMMIEEPRIEVESLKKIEVETLILVGSKDLIKEEHTREISNNIKNSKLIILRKETHSSYVINSLKLYDIISDFLGILS